MVKKKTWQEFRKTGLLWFINTILHVFGWAIVVEVEKGEITGAYPARVRFRGFDEVSNTTGYQNVARYMKEEADQLIKEAADSDNEEVELKRPLTIEELKQMSGQPVWCPEEEAYGIVMCDKIGQWAGIPFLHGVWYSNDDGVGVEFNHNIIGRKLKCFRVEDKKEIAMPPQNKEIGFGDQTLACPNCGQSAIVNPFRKDREIYPYCPWCGQKLKEAEDEQTE